MKTASFGSVSHGTMRTEDLIPEFAYTLRDLRGALPIDIARAVRKFDAGTLNQESQDFLVEALFDGLEEFSPPYGYFGAHAGDGSDYGFWLSESALEDFDGIKVDDTSSVPAEYTGEVMHVNDHGNVTLYAARRGKLREIWSIV